MKKENSPPHKGDEAPPYVLPQTNIRSTDLSLVGGKGANLGELAAAGFPVPPGYCVTTFAFASFLASSESMDDVFAALAAVDPQDLETLCDAGEQVRTGLGSVDMPQDVAAAVLEIWNETGPDWAYAVRSSATAEDLPGASFAGQHDTFLNVRGADDLLEAVHRCWISLFTDRAILYRIQSGFDHRDSLLAVVVQQMVEPVVSGILFTADPVSGNRHIASIDASYGLGEALVSGLVSADLYKVDRRNQREVDAQIADKQIAIWPLPTGGTEQRPVEESQRHARALSATQTLALAALGTRIEDHYGAPQDIEWALVGDELFILQSRLITSLYPLPKPAHRDDAKHVYVSFGHPQMMTDPMPPMGLSVLRLLLSFGRQSGSMDYNPFVPTAGGRIYVDATALLSHPLGRRILTKAFTVADRLSSDVLGEIASEPEFQEQAQAARLGASTRGIALWLAPIAGGVMADLWLRSPDGRVDEVGAWLDQMETEIESELDAASPGAERLAAAQRILATCLETVLRTLAHNIGGGFVSQLLVKRVAGEQADPQDLAAFMRGLTGNVATEMDLEVGDLADAARQSPALVAHLGGHDAATALDALDEVAGSPAFRAQWDRFMASYGMRGPAEIDITRPRWSDDPTSLMQMVLGNLEQIEPGLHRRRHAEMAAEAKAAASRLAEAVNHGPAGPLKAAVVRRQTRVARNLMAVREHPKFLLVRIMVLVRAALLEAGDMLVGAGRIDTAEDIWYLDLIEAVQIMEQPGEELRSRIASRKADLDHYRRLSPPRVMTSDGEIPAVSHRRDDLPAGALAGNPVSAGVVEGVAKVVLDPAREQLLPGEILVAPFTDPGWTPLFINAAGLVLEVGGLMTHGSVVAREYGVPAVVGVLDATTLIQTGQRVRVSGDRGFVEILEPET